MYTENNTTPKQGFVLHGTLGNYNGALEWLTTNRNDHPSSAHYIIGKNVGEVIQLVQNKDIAWHAGTVQNPTQYAQACLLKDQRGKYINPNNYLIGIEFVWFVGDTLTDWQYHTAIEIMKATNISNPIIVDHHSICDYKGDDLFFAIDRIRQGLVEPTYTQTIAPVEPEIAPTVAPVTVQGILSSKTIWLGAIITFLQSIPTDILPATYSHYITVMLGILVVANRFLTTRAIQ